MSSFRTAIEAVDVKIAALWGFHGWQHVLRPRNEDFDPAWEAGLAKKTGLWKGESGVLAERWRLWADELSSNPQFDGQEAETRPQRKSFVSIKSGELLRERRPDDIPIRMKVCLHDQA
ncbi:uncharacterized protein RCC_07019 [Ramularia collo-cygni]|uniref:Uncharacterized protein n=1 Tax=Ramularia collo-cygni TaxID=112498 RepID=A0A2D3V052_9PEZI|nr:uncharacterized protein RCC_07019 [Ramularia collo-cygni]CZT21158.1 uncharacterized protein RCC_07019 [Ramularia collo-cygni]